MEIPDLKFGGNTYKPTIRTVNDIKNVLYDLNWLKTAENFVVYSFFRNLHLSEKDKITAKEHDVQYDITTIPPNTLGSEFTKTKGHYHPKKPGANMSYPEIYEVLSGEAHYLLQKEENGRVVDAVMVKASPGDKVMIPSNYGHITINASNKTLKMANWVCSSFASDYGSIEKRKGGAYYMLTNGKFIPNKNYEKVPALRFVEPADLSAHGIKKKETLYNLIHDITLLRFLTHPEEIKSNMFVL